MTVATAATAVTTRHGTLDLTLRELRRARELRLLIFLPDTYSVSMPRIWRAVRCRQKKTHQEEKQGGRVTCEGRRGFLRQGDLKNVISLKIKHNGCVYLFTEKTLH